MIIRIFQLGIYHIEGAADNPEKLSEIGLNTHASKQNIEGVELPLHPLEVNGNNKTVVHVKERGVE